MPTTSSTRSTPRWTPPRRVGVLQQLSEGLDRSIRVTPCWRPSSTPCTGTASTRRLFDDFLASMRMDLTSPTIPTGRRSTLHQGLRGSDRAASASDPGHRRRPGQAAPHAAALGRAFQLTNFLRDVDEDLVRGRVYLPADELASHDVDRELLTWCHDNRTTDKRVRKALADQHEIARERLPLRAKAFRCWSRGRGRASRLR